MTPCPTCWLSCIINLSSQTPLSGPDGRSNSHKLVNARSHGHALPPPHPTDRRSSIVPHSPATSESEPVQESRWAIQHLCHAIFVCLARFLVGFSVMGGAEYIIVSAALAAAWNVHSGFAANGLYEGFTCFFLVVSRPSMASLIWAATGAQGCYWRLLLKPIATGPSGVEEPAFTSSPSACHLLCSSKVSPIHLLTGFGERC